jgi:hypothetical protein
MTPPKIELKISSTMKHLIFCTFWLLVFAGKIFAQDTTATLVFSGYAETFYAFDANRPAGNERPGFLYSHNRQNEFNLNLGFLKAAYAAPKIRANLALATGTYMADNYAAEPIGLRNILEANVGLKLGAKTWLDAGIIPSHIGFESAISKDCWTLTRGILAENSPYYEAGAKITHAPNDRWTLTALVLNGWQRIARINTTPAFGTQVQWKPNARTLLNWSTYIGNEQPADVDARWRLFNNLYGVFQLTDRVGLILGFDVGIQKAADREGQDGWLTPNVVLRTQLSKKWALAARVENYTDRDGLIIGIPDFSVTGGSVNLDFAAAPNALLRFEARYLGSEDAIFIGKNDLKNGRLYGTASLAVGF